MDLTAYTLAALAGLLTTLSPCVLPVLPLVLASSLKAGRRGPLFFVCGLLLTFVGISWTISSFGTLLGLDRDVIRNFSALVLVIAGILFISECAQGGLATLLAPLLNRANRTTSQIDQLDKSNKQGTKQFLLGALTGIIWTPCSGPSLGLAISLAAERQNAASSLLLLLVFGIGAGIPILAIAYGSASLTDRLRSVSMRSSSLIKKVLGVLIILIGISILSGFDKQIEAWLVQHSPEWLTDLTTRF